jgi:membrane protein YqaA with SNARE-associated domain
MVGVQALLHWLALPEIGLSAVFLIALVSATLLPMGSEPAVFALVNYQPALFWPAVLVATAGNTVGGGITWWMGRGARLAADRLRHTRQAPPDESPVSGNGRAVRWLERFGAKACLLSWLPVVGDPLCAVAGWQRLPFWPCLGYMAVGKLLRYLAMTSTLLWLV